MKHISCQTDDVPVMPIVMDRRRTPDRRVEWRGGRRDDDWLHRPEGIWPEAVARHERSQRWGRVFSALHLW